MFKILLIKNDGTKSYNITPIIEKISWESNLSLMSVIEFSVIWNDTRFFPKNPVEIGDIVLITKDDAEVNRGVIVNEDRQGRQPITYKAFDYAWYLGKSKSVYQFSKISATQAITKILNDFGMLVGSIAKMNTIVDKIYIEKSPAEIIWDIIKMEEQQRGFKFNAELRKGRIYIERMKDLVIKGTFKLAENVTAYDILSNPLDASRSRSIEDMKNRINVIVELDDNDKQKAGYVTTAFEQDANLISKYGLLEETVSVDAGDSAKSREVAKILLKRLGRIHESNSLKLMGDVRFKAGRLFDVIKPITGMNGRFMIRSTKHEVINQIHTMELELALPEDVA
jgi:hypothetical protein